jgi:Flp pilus assembly protein TadG
MVRILKRNGRGLATVEMAIVLLLLVMVTMGAIRYGWLFLKVQQITNAARQGARLAILPNVTPTNVTDAIGLLMDAAGMPEASSGYSVAITNGDLSSIGDPNQITVTVRITVPRANIDIMDLALLPAPTNLGAEVTMAKEEEN